MLKTADLADQYADELQFAESIFRSFGGNPAFSGAISTVECFEDNSLVKSTLSTPGHGRVLVVGGGGSTRCALVGDVLGAMAVEQGWAGIVVYGAVRDTLELAKLDLGVLALGSHPAKSTKRERGRVDVSLQFAGARFRPGDYLYADEDGMVLAKRPLS